MHTTTLILLMFLTSLTPLFSRASVADTIPDRKGIGTIYYLPDKKIRGYLLNVSDSSVNIIEKKYWNSGLYSQQQTIPVEQITGIKKKSRSGMSTLEAMGIGGIGGTILGFAISISDCDDPDNDCGFFERLFSAKSFKSAVTFGVILGGIGTIVGLISGGKKKKTFHINGNRDALISNKNQILFY